MRGTDRITTVIRSHLQSTWGVTMDLVWTTTDPDGEVSLLVSADVARQILTPPDSWWRILDTRRLSAYAVETVVQNADGSICVRARRTPIYALERNRFVEGVPHVH